MGNVHMEATQINYREGGTKMSVAQAIKNAGSEITPKEKTWIDSIPALTTSNAGKTDQTVIAPEFDAEAGTYAIGDLVMYEGKLYEFTSSHETAGDWNAEEVSEKTVADEIGDVKSGLTNLSAEYVIEEYEVYDHTGTTPELSNGTRYNYVHNINKTGYTPICANCRYASNQGSADIDVYFGKEGGSWRVRVIVYNTWDGGTIAPPDYVSVLYKKNAT